MSDLEGHTTATRKGDAADEADLAKLGYKQELNRQWSLLQVR